MQIFPDKPSRDATGLPTTHALLITLPHDRQVKGQPPTWQLHNRHLQSVQWFSNTILIRWQLKRWAQACWHGVSSTAHLLQEKHEMLNGALLIVPTAQGPRPASAAALQPPGWLPGPPNASSWPEAGRSLSRKKGETMHALMSWKWPLAHS